MKKIINNISIKSFTESTGIEKHISFPEISESGLFTSGDLSLSGYLQDNGIYNIYGQSGENYYYIESKNISVENAASGFYWRTGNSGEWGESFSGYGNFKAEISISNDGKIYRIGSHNSSINFENFRIMKLSGEEIRPINLDYQLGTNL